MLPAVISHRHHGTTFRSLNHLPITSTNYYFRPFHAFSFNPVFWKVTPHSTTHLPSCSFVAVINNKSSAYRNSEGRTFLASLETTSMTTANWSGLNTDPWCKPTFTSKLSLNAASVLTTVQTSVYNAITVRMNHSSTPSFLKALSPLRHDTQIPFSNPQRHSTVSSSFLGASPRLVTWWKGHQWSPCQAYNQTARQQLTPDPLFQLSLTASTIRYHTDTIQRTEQVPIELDISAIEK